MEFIYQQLLAVDINLLVWLLKLYSNYIALVEACPGCIHRNWEQKEVVCTLVFVNSLSLGFLRLCEFTASVFQTRGPCQRSLQILPNGK